MFDGGARAPRIRRVLVTALAALTLAATACAWAVLRPAPSTADDTGPVPAPARPAAGALFGGPADDPGSHYCSGSVVASGDGDLVITAAHCVADGDGTPARTGMTFAPGYTAGVAPYGYWTVTAAAVGPDWLVTGDPDDDVAFLTVERAGWPPVQEVTGAYRVDFGDLPGAVAVTAVGYNSGAREASVIPGTVTPQSATQLRFDRPGLDDGSSGGPLLTGPDGTEIVGVIGGYEQGGDTPDVSYAAELGTALQALYDQAGGVG